jgi:hypothetical protein
MLGIPTYKRYRKIVQFLGTVGYDLNTKNKSNPCIRNPTPNLWTFFAPKQALMIVDQANGVDISFVDLFQCNSYPFITIPNEHVLGSVAITRNEGKQPILFSLDSGKFASLDIDKKQFDIFDGPPIPLKWDHAIFKSFCLI